jgi:hypothetical protein
LLCDVTNSILYLNIKLLSDKCYRGALVDQPNLYFLFFIYVNTFMQKEKETKRRIKGHKGVEFEDIAFVEATGLEIR